MARIYTPEEIAAVAQQTAQEVGCEAVRWWQDEGDPRRVYLIAHHRLLSGRTIPVRLMAFVSEALPSTPAQPDNGRGHETPDHTPRPCAVRGRGVSSLPAGASAAGGEGATA